jgi:predicted transposase YdaD
MKESSTYQEIVQDVMQKGIKKGIRKGEKKGMEKGIEKGIEKGRAAEALAFLLRRGEKAFGAPDTATLRKLEAMTDPSQLEALTDRVIDGQAGSWVSLLNPVVGRRRS